MWSGNINDSSILLIFLGQKHFVKGLTFGAVNNEKGFILWNYKFRLFYL